MSTAANDSALLRKPAVLALAGFGTTTLYDRIKSGLFTQPIRIGARLSAWRASEVKAINDAIAAGLPDDEIRELVRSLEEQRKSASH